MAVAAREENEALKARLDALEGKAPPSRPRRKAQPPARDAPDYPQLC